MDQRDLTTELRHRHEQRKATTTILIALLMLFFAFWYAFSYYRASGGDEANAGATCRPYDPKVATPGNTTVNVLNATSKNGLAARTASELRRRGFQVGEVKNDQSGRKVAAAEVRFGPSGKGHAALVVPLGGKGTKQVADKRKGTTVDLVLGNSFATLAPAPTSTGKPMCPAPSSSPSASAAAN